MDFQIIGKQSSLALLTAKKMNKELIVPEIIQFADGEIEVKFANPIQLREKKTIIIHSTSNPVHDNLMQLFLLINEVRNAKATKIFVLIPYFGYGRHDQPIIPHTQSVAQLIAKLIESTGIDKILVVEMHSEKMKNFLSIPVENMCLADFIAAHIKKQFNDMSNICLVAPDKGAYNRVKKVATILGVEYQCFEKKRIEPNKTEIISIPKVAQNSIAIVIDDIIDTGGTALAACDRLIAQGFDQVFGYFVHPVLSHNAIEKIETSKFKRIFISNSISIDAAEKIEVFDIADEIIKKVEKLN